MPYSFGSGSRAKLDTVHPDLRECAELALSRSPYDFTIVHGWRGEEVQNALFASGASTKRYPESKHNGTVDIAYVSQGNKQFEISDAIDFAPWIDGTIPWGETHIFACIAGCLFAAADELGIKLRWGGDWDTDGNTKEHRLQDWGHVEIMHD